MSRTKIEWVRNPDGSQGYTVNPVKGYCPMACPYCYARRMYDRFGWDKTIRFEPQVLLQATSQLAQIPPSHIFIGSTIELFGPWVDDMMIHRILYMVKLFPQHTFIFLTKQPQNLLKWRPFPANVWLGTSVTSTADVIERSFYLSEIPEGKVRFLSYEPLLAPAMLWDEASWIIIGAETGNRKEKPPLEQVQSWAKEIIAAADEAGIPVFLKDNLHLAKHGGIIRQEFPKGVEDATKRVHIIGRSERENKPNIKR